MTSTDLTPLNRVTATLERDLTRKACTLIREARGIGLIVVHVGELENWLRGAGIQASKECKAEWAMEAAVFLESEPAAKSDLWKFMSDAARYLDESRISL